MKRCTGCGLTYDDDYVFCTNCSGKLVEIPQETTPEGEKPASRSHKGLIAVAITAIVAVAAVAIVAIIMIGPREDGVPVSLVVSIPEYNQAPDTPLIVHFEGTTKEGKPESRDLVFGGNKQPRIPEGNYSACPVASPVLADGSIYAVPAAVNITVSADEQREQPTIAFTRKLAGAEITDDIVAASLKMMSDAGCEAAKVNELQTAAEKSRDAQIPGNTSGNIVNDGRVVEVDNVAYFLANEYSDENVGKSPYGVNGHIYSTSDGERFQEVYNQAGEIFGLNHAGDKFYFFEWMPGDSENARSLVSVSDSFDPSTIQKYYTCEGYLDSLNATTEYAYYAVADDGVYSIMRTHYSSGTTDALYTDSFIDSLSLYGSHLYFLSSDAASNRGYTRIVRTDIDGQNETVLYTSNKALDSLNVGPEGLTFAERDDSSFASTVRRLQLDGTDTGLSATLQHASVGGLNVVGGWTYTVTSGYYKDTPFGLDYLSVLDLQTGKANTQKLERGGRARSLCTAIGYAFYEGGYAVDDEEIPPVPLPDPANMTPRENADSSYHVATSDYEFDIPEYWRGKVEYETTIAGSGYTMTIIYLAGHSEKDSNGSFIYRLATVESNPYSREIEGDIGGHKVCDADSGGKYVSVWTVCWPFEAWLCNSDTKTYSSKYDASLISELVDLSTGGAVSYEEAIQSDTSGVNDEINFNHDAFERTLRVVD